jgi:DNA polymerase (family X)
VTNSEIARLLNNVASAYAIEDEKKFRFQILAYRKAADAIEHTTTELKELSKEGKLENLPGIGPSIKAHIEELLKTGKVKHFESVLGKIPSSVFPLLDVPGFGPKKAYKLVSEFKLENPASVISDLINLAKKGEIAKIEGFGAKSEEDILQAFKEYGLGKTKTARMVLPYANELAKKMVLYLQKSPDIIEVSTLGSLRRKKSTVGDIDIAVSTNNPGKAIEHFTKYPHTERIIEKGSRTSSLLTSGGRQIDLMVESPKGFGALLQHFTGSKEHNVHLRELALKMGYSLSDYGVKKKNEKNPKLMLFKSENELYKFLNLDFIPPEMREDTGEIELAGVHKLPALIELKDIRGDFHLHSDYPIEPSHDMGQNSMEAMIKNALNLNYKYIGFSEHNPSISKHTKAEINDIVLKRNKFIDQLRNEYKKSIHIFSLMETDILPSGKLALEEDTLNELDGSIVSVHSSFDMDRDKMTERVLKGLSHRKAKILAHPTGRLLNQRSGYELNWNAVFEFCVKNNKAMEINSWPLRLDLPDVLVKDAIKKGVKLIINTDSHATDHMRLMEYGVSVARRGWATKDDIINSWEYNKVKDFFS